MTYQLCPVSVASCVSNTPQEESEDESPAAPTIVAWTGERVVAQIAADVQATQDVTGFTEIQCRAILRRHG